MPETTVNELIEMMKQKGEKLGYNISLVLHEDGSGSVHYFGDIDYNALTAEFHFNSIPDLIDKLK